MERTDLLKILHGDISYLDNVNIDDIALYDVRVTVTPKYVERVLLGYLDGSLNANDIKRWANFLCSRSEYVTQNSQDDKIADYYEDMWYIVQRLSTPEIDGEINKEQIKQYLIELRKYNK